jgi:hypothetical protein
MGRTLKRVAIDFDWPRNKVWKGYINPHFKPCPEAGKTCFHGSNAASVYLSHLANMFAVVADSADRGKTHPYCNTLPYGGDHPDWEIQPKEVRQRFVDFVGKLTEARKGIFGYSNSGCDIYFKLLDMVGIKLDRESDTNPAYDWGHCPVCKGESLDPAVKKEYDAWQEYEPPAGDGFQLWETTSEGSPISPVFKTLDELCTWAAKNSSTFGSGKATAAQWKKMLEDDFVHHKDEQSGIICI